jgi:uncharacterized protein (DUF1800 family)
MRSVGLVPAIAALFAMVASTTGDATGRFDVRLAGEKQPLHVLNRLAYGPRPGDVDDVRRMGVDAWIRRQLDPARIPENPVLEARLESLVTVHLSTWRLFETVQPPQVQFRTTTPSLSQLLAADQIQKLTAPATSPDDRRAVLAGLTPDVRRQVLAVTPPQAFEKVPELKQEAERASQIQQEIQSRERQEQQRRLYPPLYEILTPEQSRDIRQGTDEEKASVLVALDAVRRRQVFRMLGPEAARGLPEAYRREALLVADPQRAVISELVEARLQRGIYSNRQLQEVLVDFWFNHFNVFVGKNQVPMLLPSYEREAIRPYVLGRFRDMLLATARHPAMLVYLDNYLSQAPRTDTGIVVPGVRRPGLNENYGRELMELHTLGVDGGYTQEDVVNVARVFSGWTVYDVNRVGEFQFNPGNHDRGEKVVLGHTFPRGGGESEGVAVIDLLARHPATARFISRELAQRFVADAPPQRLVDRMAATFTRTDGDLRAVMETMLLSKEFFSEGAWQAKVKSPIELVTSALRAVNAEVTDTTAIAQRIADLGQPLYGKVEPTGYPNTGDAWAGSAGLLGRMNFASALTAGEIAGARVTPETVLAGGMRRAMLEFAGTGAPADVLAAANTGPDGNSPTAAVMATVLIGSPGFQKR